MSLIIGNVTIGDMIIDARPPVVYLITTAGYGSVTGPADYGNIICEAVGAGGPGFNSPTNNASQAGGGGAYALSTIATSGTVFYCVAQPGVVIQSWTNTQGNSVPSTSATGVLAAGGQPGASGIPGAGGTIAQCIYNGVAYAGGTGSGSVNTTGGGGGAGDSGPGGNGSGGTGGAGGTGVNITGGSGGSGTNGNSPGGGAGGVRNGAATVGGTGLVRITFIP